MIAKDELDRLLALEIEPALIPITTGEDAPWKLVLPLAAAEMGVEELLVLNPVPDTMACKNVRSLECRLLDLKLGDLLFPLK